MACMPKLGVSFRGEEGNNFAFHALCCLKRNTTGLFTRKGLFGHVFSGHAHFIWRSDMKKQTFTIYEICLMALLAATGMFIKPIISPVFNLLTDFIRIPGGSVTAGFSMLFPVFGCAYIQKKGTAFLMGFVQAFISLTSGISATAGILVLITYSMPGAAIDLIICGNLFRKLPLQSRMMLAGAAGVLTGAALTNMLYFHLSLLPFILFYIFGILSGALGGYIAAVTMEALPKSFIKRGQER